jgi:hypothetical protein
VRTLATAVVVATCLGLFVWEWEAAPRVHATDRVVRGLSGVRGRLYLGTTFHGLPLRSVRPFVYSDCVPHRPHLVPCTWIVVRDGRVRASSPALAGAARRALRPVA